MASYFPQLVSKEDNLSIDEEILKDELPTMMSSFQKDKKS